MKYRLEQMFPGISFKVIGEPTSVADAQRLAEENRFQFEWWALSLVRARPIGGEQGSKQGKKGADKGMDGVIAFLDEAQGKPKRILVQVKSGHVGSHHIRDLVGTVEREKAAMGVLVTLEPPTTAMESEAFSSGYYYSPGWGQDYHKIQILTIEQLLNGAVVGMPPEWGTFKQARKVESEPGATQAQMDLF